MTLGQTIRKSYGEIRQSWTRLADHAFGMVSPAAQDEMSRGEFISPFISEGGLSFPRAGERPPRTQR